MKARSCHHPAGLRLATLASACLLWGGATASAQSEQSVTDVLRFLMTNRSIPTDDFVRDEEAAAETARVLARFLTLELATLPVPTSAGGFTYRLDPALGTVVRSSDSFGPFFAERSLSAGRNHASVGLAYRSSSFRDIDGRNLRDGTLISTASVLRGSTVPFDIETVALRIRTDTATLTGNYGVSDRADIGIAVPFVRVRLDGQRVDTYRGRTVVQAAGSASASGVGDVVLRTKYNVFREGASGLAVAGEVRLPVGREEDLLGGGRTTITPRLIASYEGSRVGLHGDVGYAFRESSNVLGYAAALTVVAAPRFTVVGELLGRRIEGLGRLADTTQPHPRLVGVDTIRLTRVARTTDRILLAAGIKWNVADTWLATANVRKALTSDGLDAGWVPTVTLEYTLGR
ncbi:MAG: transporter [Vicinamibacterales bacterium]